MNKLVYTPDYSYLDSVNKREQIISELEPLIVREDRAVRLKEVLSQEIQDGLHDSQSIRARSSLMMQNSFVPELLNGTENGDYLALDLGGTNFRVLLCRFLNGKCESISRNYNVTETQLSGPASDVFDHLAISVAKFLHEENLNVNKTIPLGFTFSFPMSQNSIDIGILQTWTKTFSCPDGVGEDAVVMLQQAFQRNKVTNVDIVAILNDTTGTLLAGSYLDHRCQIGVIMGTGYNIAYMEKASRVLKWKRDCENEFSNIKQNDKVVIDTEIGAFGDNGSLDFLRSDEDLLINQNSHHIDSFTFEKLFSGLYVGDLVRLWLLKLATKKLIFPSKVPETLTRWGSITAEHLSEIAGESKGGRNYLSRLLSEIGAQDATDDEIAVIKFVCYLVTLRTSTLITTCLVVLLERIEESEVSIAIDGSLYKHHPLLHSMMTESLEKRLPNKKVRLFPAEDGSGRGAAFVAAVIDRLKSNKRTFDENKHSS